MQSPIETSISSQATTPVTAPADASATTTESTSASAPAAVSSASKWFKRLAWLAGGVLVLGAASWVLVPPILKSQLEKLASEQLGRKFTVGKIDFRPWSLELSLDELALAKADGSAPQVQIKRIYADASIQSVRRLAPVLDALQIDGLDVKLTHLGGGKYDIDDVIARLNKPPEKPVDPNAKPPGFALFNVALNGASLDFTDKTVNKTHELRALNLSVPFLSNLDTLREVKTEPRLAFKFNGSAFESQAATTPFTESHKTDAAIRLAGLDLKPYLGYLPASLPVRLHSAVLEADVKLAFEQAPRVAVKLTGTVQAKTVELQDAAKQELLKLDALKVVLDDVRPLEQVAKLSLVDISAPTLQVKRDPGGRLNLQLQGAPGGEAKTPDPVEPKKEAAAPKWQIDITAVVLQGGVVNFQDQTTQPAAHLALKDMALRADGIVWPFVKPLQFSGSGSLVGGWTPVADSTSKPAALPAVPGSVEAASLKFDGSATDAAANVNASLGNLNLELAAPYVQSFLKPHLGGIFAAELAVAWTPSNLKISAKQVTLNNLALLDQPQGMEKPAKVAESGKNPAKKAASGAGGASGVGQAAAQVGLQQGTLASLKTLDITGSEIDLGRQTVLVGKVSLVQPAMAVERDSSRRWMFERWLKSAAATASSTAETKGESKDESKAWAVTLKDIQIDGGQFQFNDNGVAQPVALELLAVKVGMKDVMLDGKKPFPLTVSFKLRQARGEPGQLEYKGNLGLTPLSAAGSLVATQIPVHAFEPYFGDALNIELLRADVGFKGDLRFASGPTGAAVKVTGDSVLEEFRAHTVAGVQGASSTSSTPSAPATSAATSAATSGQSAPAAAQTAIAPSAPTEPGGLKISEELLTWKALSLRGLDVALAPGTATQISVSETVLTDFFARVKIDPTGRINLQDLVKSTGQGQAPEVTQNAKNSVAGKAVPERPGGQNDPGASAPATSTVATAPTVASGGANPATGPEAVINIGPVSLINGKVFFSDQFIKPNYSANLSELNGRLSAFSSAGGQSAGPQMADLELRGRAEGTAALEILGKLNPLAKPLALDIKATVRDLELPPLSPYSVKYAGHAIERGKLSVDLAYLVLPSGQLDAKNKLILNQLKFGDKVEGAPASLPVRLAVALLADRNGVIDLDLPVSGSLNDPQFSLGPIIFKIIVNVIVKAITSPFSLLAAAFGGGGDELSQVAFAPGSATLSAEAKTGLDKVAKALTERPALKMTVIGTSSLAEERDGYKQERLKALLQAEKRRAQVVGGSLGGAATPAAGASAAAATMPVLTMVSDTEIPALIKEVYKRSDFPKPRTTAGAAKEPTREEMEALLLQNIVVTEDQIRELAVQRGVAVKDYLASKQLPVERLFLGSVKTGSSEAKATDAGSGATTTAADANSEGKPAAPQARWTPRAELNLATN